jgi:hypothetical protein
MCGIVHSALIYIIVVKVRNAIYVPLQPQFLRHWRAALSTNSKGTHAVCVYTV